MPLYDEIGKGYNTTRKADPYLTDRFYEFLAAKPGGVYLDAGCGTGNYLSAMVNRGLQLYGVDASETMLNEARGKNTAARLIHGSIEELPLADGFFDGATAVLTMHHWGDLNKGLAEIYRVLKPWARLVAFSFTPEQVRGYWLEHYFPTMIERAAKTVPELDEMEHMLREIGFASVSFENYFVLPELEDHFMYSCKHVPERVLIPEMRKNTSGFTALANQEEIVQGLARLEDDIKTGRIAEVMDDYENDLGDYLFIVAEK